MHRIILTILCLVPFYAHAAKLDACARLIDTEKAETLRKELLSSGLPHFVDQRIICVEEKHRYALQMILKQVFPHDSNVVQKDWIFFPKSPSDSNLDYLLPINRPMHEALKNELSRQNIWFTTDKEDILWFEVSQRHRVVDIIFGISEGRYKVERQSTATP